MAGEQHPFDLPHDPGGNAPGVGDGAAQGATPDSPPTEPDYKKLYEESSATVKALEPLAPIAEMLKDPAVRQTVIARVMGTGVPTEAAQPAVDPRAVQAQNEAAIKAKYQPQMQKAIESGDFAAYGDAAAEMGAELGAARSSAQMNAAAGPLVNMTARNTIENWCAGKRQTSPLFVKLEGQMRAEIDRTAPAKLAELVTNGLLIPALETAWSGVVAKNYEQSYNKASAEGKLDNLRQEPPNYGGNRGGGSMPSRERVDEADDKDDEEFNKLAEKADLQFQYDDRTGAMTGEIRR